MCATSGHGPFGYHQNLVNPEVNPLCRFCGEIPETFYHLVTDCPLLRQRRADCLGYYETDELYEWNVLAIKSFIETECVVAVFREREGQSDTSVSIVEDSVQED